MIRASVLLTGAVVLALTVLTSSTVVLASPAPQRGEAGLVPEEEVTGARLPTWGSDCLRGQCQQVVFNLKASGVSSSQEACDAFELTCSRRDGNTLTDSDSTCSRWTDDNTIIASCTTRGETGDVVYGVTGDVGRVSNLLQQDGKVTIPAIIVRDYRNVKDDSNFPTVKDQCAGNPPDRQYCDMHLFEWIRAFSESKKPSASVNDICDYWATTCEGIPALRDVVFRPKCHIIDAAKGIISASCGRKEPTGVWLSDTRSAALNLKVQAVQPQLGRQCDEWTQGYCTADYPEVAVFSSE
ncbi:hypothetical protein CBOM_00094 [Ceraceosorus bombacis]|uniref:Uncharacterized protein n=1 Tax=Ceraceosorus bombacis TaxID=401625 RepID=A0A0P1B8H7_9BASI|nr:hypothetical protein CBOM_00094 [Ceraceosorus bombacis]